MFGNKKNNFKSGQAVMITVVFFLFIALAVFFGLVFSAVYGAQIGQILLHSKQSYFLSESGLEDVVYRATRGMVYSVEEEMVIGNYYATTTVADIAGDLDIISVGNVDGNLRKVKMILTNDVGVAFNYGVQVGDGGLTMSNNSLISGNVYVNGTISAANSNEVKGDVVSAGLGGFVDGVHATGSVYAHNISDSFVEKDAYYQVIDIPTIVLGTKYPDSPDLPAIEMPISDELIESWESLASANVISSPCPYEIDSDTLLGPAKIECDLIINGDPVITIGGHIWVEGNINIKNSAILRLNPAVGKKSIALIADNPSNRLTSSKITLDNSVFFEGSGLGSSFILVVSQNNSAENGGVENAITIKNTVSGDLLIYSGHGKIYLNNNSDLREVTGYAIDLSNQANVIYETGLANLLFDSGPAGGFGISVWKEID